MRGSSAHASRKVPLRSASGPAERGNISYHAPNRARSRSTHTRRGADAVARDAIGIGRHDRRELVAERDLDAFGGRRRVVERVGPLEQPGAGPWSTGPRGRRRESAATPSSSSSETSWPAAALSFRSRRQVRNRSTQATTWYSCQPTASTRSARSTGRCRARRGSSASRATRPTIEPQRPQRSQRTMFCSAVSACSAVERGSIAQRRPR